jgi:beta-glucosidase
MFKASDFGPDFVWGVAASAAQTEGAIDVDGRSFSIWDHFAGKKGKIKGNHHPGNTCEFYHRYEQDVQLIQSLNIPNFRFSLSWSRILPEGTGRVNQKGMDFYKRLIDQLLLAGIEPWVTLYHWDLPQVLENRGGWTNRDMLDWFAEYADACGRELSGTGVRNWLVLNEPLAFTGVGYFLGYHAPGRKGFRNFLPAMLHAMLCTGIGERALRRHMPQASIGSSFSCSLVTPGSNSHADLRAADRADALLNRLFVEAAVGRGFPTDKLPFLRKVEKYMKPGDEGLLKANLDFLGIQNYTREVVKSCWYAPYLRARLVNARNRGVPHTSMNWEIFPDSMLAMLRQFSAYGLPLVVTENGASFLDQHHEASDTIHDPERLHFLQEYIRRVKQAMEEGIPVKGYFVWSLTDNFEWAEGFSQRFGLVYVNFLNQRRIVKASGIWYRDFLTGNE